jgi:hypothetical protein
MLVKAALNAPSGGDAEDLVFSLGALELEVISYRLRVPGFHLQVLSYHRLLCCPHGLFTGISVVFVSVGGTVKGLGKGCFTTVAQVIVDC